MTPTEAALLCRLTKSACPQQKFDEYTPDLWGELLADVRFIDAKEALMTIAARQPFVAPSEIIAEVKRIRSKRIAEFGPIPPPPAEELDPDNWRAFQQWQIDTERAIADGDLKPAELDLPKRDMKQLENTFKRPR